MSNFLSKLITLALPYTCILCHTQAKNKDLCLACVGELPWLKQVCQQCALPLEQVSQTNCGYCQTHKVYYDKTIALFKYDEPVSHMISQFKFHNKLIYGKLFEQLLSEKLAGQSLPELLIPVPLHAKRLKERGYNQALELARPLAKRLKISLDYKSLQRVRATEQQSLITADKRKANVKNAFALRHLLRHKHIGLVDDVITTGHTINECSKILKQAGVEKITVIAVARTG